MDLTYDNLIKVIDSIKTERVDHPCNTWGCVGTHSTDMIDKEILLYKLRDNFYIDSNFVI